MKLNDQLKEILMQINAKLPPEKRAEFARRIRERFKTLQIDDLAGYTIAGALVGAVCEALPLDTITGVDDWVEVGAALGATIGYVVTAKERRTRREVELAIREEVLNVLGTTD
jgi:hypothetical protein